jgi:peptidoglycan/LPS O-acetylase OafA/YrhL
MRHTRKLELDVLRSLAILLLLFHHAGVYAFEIMGNSFRFLAQYVNFHLLGSFAFISGYLMSRSLRQARMADLPGYYIQRLWRLFPPYWLAIILFFFVMRLDMNAVDIIIHQLGLQLLLAPRLTEPILTLWFIGLLAALLMAFPFLLILTRRPAAAGISFALVFVLAAWIHGEFDIMDLRLFYFYPIYALGSLFGMSERLDRLASQGWFHLAMLGMMLVGALLMPAYRRGYADHLSAVHIAEVTVFMSGSILFVLGLARRITPPAGVVRLITAISVGSYFTYLFHRPFWAGLLAISEPASVSGRFWWQILVGAPLLIAASYFFQSAYDSWQGPRPVNRES